MLTKSVPVWGFFFFKLLTILPQVQQGHMSKLVSFSELRNRGFSEIKRLMKVTGNNLLLQLLVVLK